MYAYKSARGFTMIELIMVIVLMSIISLAGIEIIGFTTEAYSKMLGRQTLGNSARIAIDRISRELRGALPNSARAMGKCLEFIPINAAGRYVDLPLEASSLNFQAIALDNSQNGAIGRIAVYPLDESSYDLSSQVLSGAATLSSPDINNEIQVTMSSAHQFPNGSPGNRFYISADPVSFCIDGDNLFRYQNYGFNTVQLGVAALPASLPNRALLVNEVGSSASPFTVINQSLQRNAIVAISLAFVSDNESVQLVHEVQLRNVQ